MIKKCFFDFVKEYRSAKLKICVILKNVPKTRVSINKTTFLDVDFILLLIVFKRIKKPIMVTTEFKITG
jgi:hypothetical protein